MRKLLKIIFISMLLLMEFNCDNNSDEPYIGLMLLQPRNLEIYFLPFKYR